MAGECQARSRPSPEVVIKSEPRSRRAVLNETVCWRWRFARTHTNTHIIRLNTFMPTARRLHSIGRSGKSSVLRGGFPRRLVHRARVHAGAWAWFGRPDKCCRVESRRTVHLERLRSCEVRPHTVHWQACPLWRNLAGKWSDSVKSASSLPSLGVTHRHAPASPGNFDNFNRDSSIGENRPYWCQTIALAQVKYGCVCVSVSRPDVLPASESVPSGDAAAELELLGDSELARQGRGLRAFLKSLHSAITIVSSASINWCLGRYLSSRIPTMSYRHSSAKVKHSSQDPDVVL